MLGHSVNDHSVVVLKTRSGKYSSAAVVDSRDKVGQSSSWVTRAITAPGGITTSKSVFEEREICYC